MILTGKAKEDFENGIIEILKQNYNEKINDNKRAISWIYASNDLILLAHIIEWFDSVGIIITFDYFELNNGFYSEILNSDFGIIKPTRQEALTEAIKKANEIYNSK